MQHRKNLTEDMIRCHVHRSGAHATTAQSALEDASLAESAMIALEQAPRLHLIALVAHLITPCCPEYQTSNEEASAAYKSDGRLC